MNTGPLYLDTPMSKALLRLFTNLAADVAKVSTLPGSVRAYIFGGCALHIHTNARGSRDIDVEINAARWLNRGDVVISKPSITYMSEGQRKLLVIDSNFNTTLGPLHEDYQEDAIRLEHSNTKSPLWVYVVTPEDLATSKLGRFGEQDKTRQTSLAC